MGIFQVEGGHQLSGTIIPQGAKNEALQIICATLLTEEKCTISNIPDILDVNRLIELLEVIGVGINRIDSSTVCFDPSNIQIKNLVGKQYHELGGKLRGSIMMVGPLLGRFGLAYFPKPGGDKIGRRRLDTHFLGLEALGAQYEYESTLGMYKVSTKGLTGKYILLEEASVTGTANIIMAAVLAKGKTTLYNAACEPYIQQLCKMLVSMGAEIKGIGSNLLEITGVKSLGGCKHRLLPDMIEIGSFIGLAALTQSSLRIKDVSYQHLGIIPNTFKKLGIDFYQDQNDIVVNKQDLYEIDTFMDGSILTISDAIWPGLTPDLLSVLLVVATQARGSVLIHQKMFESRLFFVDKLIDMGAQIILCDPHRATIIGLQRKYPLRGIQMSSPDIRAGVALLIAALSAEGISTIHNIDQIDRGYQYIDTRLKNLGAKIERIE